MPEIPPWLGPQPQFGHLFTEGVRLRQQQQQINQQYQEAQDALEERKAQAAREDRVREQQLEIEKSYKEQMIALHQQELAEKKREMDLKTQQAAEQFAAQSRFKDLIQQAGENPNIPDLYFRSGLGGMVSPAGAASMYRAGKTSTIPPEPANVPPGFTTVPDPRTGWRVTATPSFKDMSPKPDPGAVPEGFTTIPDPRTGWRVAAKPKPVRPPAERMSDRERARLAVLKSEKALIARNHSPVPPPEKYRGPWDEENKRMKEIDAEIARITQPITGKAHYTFDLKTGQLVEAGGSSDEEED